MKKLRIVLAVLLLSTFTSPLLAGRGRIQDFVEYGGQQVVINNGLRSTSRFQLSAPQATVTVKIAGTATNATIYSDSAGTAKANPFTAGTNGFYYFYADVCVDITFSGGGLPASYTKGDVCPSSADLPYVDVASYATGGTGTQASPWTGWDTAVPWAANTEYRFRDGYFSYVNWPAAAGNKDRIALIGGNGTVLVHTGTGPAVKIGRTDIVFGAWWLWNPRLENLTIQGNVNTTYGLHLAVCVQPIAKNIRVIGASTAGILVDATILGGFENLRVTGNDIGGFVVTPQDGIVVTGTILPSSESVSNTFINTVVEGVPGSGIRIHESLRAVFKGGTSEGNGIGIETEVSVWFGGGSVGYSSFEEIHMEQNTTADMLLIAVGTIVQNVTSGGLVMVGNGATGETTFLNRFIGGFYTNITVALGCRANYFETGQIQGVVTEPNVGTNTWTHTSARQYDPVPFNAGHFTNNGGTSVTVDAGDVTTRRFTRHTNTLIYSLYINNFDIVGSPSGIRVALPTGYTLTSTTAGTAMIRSNGVVLHGQYVATAGTTYVEFQPISGGWTASAGNAGIFATLTLEVTHVNN